MKHLEVSDHYLKGRTGCLYDSCFIVPQSARPLIKKGSGPSQRIILGRIHTVGCDWEHASGTRRACIGSHSPSPYNHAIFRYPLARKGLACMVATSSLDDKDPSSFTPETSITEKRRKFLQELWLRGWESTTLLRAHRVRHTLTGYDWLTICFRRH